MTISQPVYTKAEELLHALTHGIGALFSIAGLVILVVLSALYGTAWHVVSCSIYGATLIILYTASTLYHSVTSPRWKKRMRIFDHASIFLLIAGTYTPFMLVNLRGPWGWSIFGVIWGLAIVGLVFKLFFTGRFGIVSTVVYVLMGWIALIAIKPMMDLIPSGGLALIFAGGLAYTGGVIFYAMKKLPYHHAIWHIFVMAGSVCHFLAVLWYVVPFA